MKNPFSFVQRKREKRESQKRADKVAKELEIEAKQKLLADLQAQQKQAEEKLDLLQSKLTSVRTAQIVDIQSRLEELGAVDSSEVGNKLFMMDKIKKQAIEVEVKDGERSVFVKGKIVEKYFLEYKIGKRKEKIIIVGPPENFERVVIPHLIVKRGIQYTHIKGEAYTHDPYMTQFDLIQVKMILGITEAVADAKMYEEIAHAARGRDKKEQMMWMIFSGAIAIVGILASGGYFK